MALVSVNKINKSFPGVQALKNICLDFNEGEVHAIIGENGAGKSTLIKILSGIYQQDSGKIYINDKEVEFKSSRDSMQAGIGTVLQELILAPGLSVIDNLFLGMESTKFIFINKKIQREKCIELLEKIGGSAIDLNKRVSLLSSAQQQLVCIAKALTYNTKILILDEVTSTLTDVDSKNLFFLIEKLKEEGHCIIYISHRIQEVIDISDVTTIMKDGQVVASRLKTKDYSIQQMVSMMIGRELKEYYPVRNKIKSDIPRFKVVDLKSNKLLGNINFEIRPGEILGCSGLVGSGRTEMARAIFGLDAKTGGTLYLNNKKLNILRPSDAIKSGIIYLPEERKLEGLFLDHPVSFNITISKIKKVLNYIRVISDKKEFNYCINLLKSMNIKCTSIKNKIINLSGGNQQKVLLARSIFTDSQVIILDEPTRGIDVGSRAEIYNLIKSYAEEGKCILVISSDMMELLGISHRIIIMRNKEIVANLEIERASERIIAEIALGTNSKINGK